MLSAVREVEVAVAIDGWAVDLSDARGGGSLGSMETVAVAGRVDLRTPVVCAVLGWGACQSANARQEQRAPKKSRAVAGADERSKIKEPTEPTRAMRCAGSNI